MHRSTTLFVILNVATGCGSVPAPAADARNNSDAISDTGADTPGGASCGDGVVNGTDVCDEATVYSSSMAAGVCRPDCSGTVQEKYVTVNLNRVSPAAGGVAGADTICQTDRGAAFKAMLVDGSTRVASATAYAGDGQVGWVLAPYTRYVSLETGLLVFITDHTRLLGAANGAGVNLYNPIRATDDGYGAWTGVAPNWTSSDDCTNWTTNVSTVNGRSCNTTATNVGGFPNNNGISNCAQLRRFFCVEQ